MRQCCCHTANHMAKLAFGPLRVSWAVIMSQKHSRKIFWVQSTFDLVYMVQDKTLKQQWWVGSKMFYACTIHRKQWHSGDKVEKTFQVATMTGEVGWGQGGLILSYWGFNCSYRGYRGLLWKEGNLWLAGWGYRGECPLKREVCMPEPSPELKWLGR